MSLPSGWTVKPWVAKISSLRIHREKRVLGVCLEEHALQIAEVEFGNGSGPVTRTAEFPYPEGHSFDQPKALGHALGDFLKKHGFSARRSVLGVPAKWLILRPYHMPPADEQTASSVLWLHATELGWPELGPMVFDFAGDSNPREPTTLLLMGLQKSWLDRLATFAAAAKLRPVTVMPTAIALGDATARQLEATLILSLHSEAVELTVQEKQHARFLRHITSLGNVQPVLGALRRTSASSDLHPDLPAETVPRKFVLWDDAGADPAFLEALRAEAGDSLVKAEPRWVGADSSVLTNGRTGLSAIALTMPARSGKRPSVDFLHPRLSPPSDQGSDNQKAWIWAASILIALTILLAMLDLSHLRGEVADTGSQLQIMSPSLEIARPFVANMEFAESFRTGNPRYLACLRDLTLAVPPEAQTEFSNFNLRSDMRGEVSGHAGTEQDVLNLMDKLSTSGRFVDLQCKLDARSLHGAAGGNVAFSVSFNYVPQKIIPGVAKAP
jgi:hypothetical protein